MKKYFLHNGTESSGPFDIVELKAKNITKQTPVWFEGMERWKTAGEIEELKSVFAVMPPPITSFSANPKTAAPKTEEIDEDEERTILGMSKTTFIIVSAILILIGGSLYINNIQQRRSEELQHKNHKTEIENYQLELQQKELEEQKIQEIIQQKIDSERIVRQKKQTLDTKLLKIENLMADSQIKIDAAERKLKEASGFKLLRSAAEKKEQMDLLEKNIELLKNQMQQLKDDSDQVKLELEKIKID